jgi:hypothetical protein
MQTITYFKTMLLSPWNFMRWLRLILGIYVGVQAILLTDALAGLISVFFLYQAITNTGCFGAASCAVPTSRPSGKTEEVTFEEINENKK